MTRKNGVNNPLITKITQLVSQDKEIALLWIYGSQADASATPESDYDLAIAFALPQGNTLESRLRSEVKALEWAEQLNLTSNQISVVDINLAPLPLAMGIIHNGVLLHQGSGLRLAREENRITSMWELDHEYHQRNLDRFYAASIKEHLVELKEQLQELEHILTQRPLSAIEYRALERNLQLLVEACIGLAKRVLKGHGCIPPSEARKAFEKLAAKGLDNSTIEWTKVIGMRNAIVHDYLDIDAARITTVLKNRDYLKLFEFAAQYL
jgi:uncharacterized protein YutE (UPF0331/DUF86 family)/predicted nucleotidyltransferase